MHFFGAYFDNLSRHLHGGINFWTIFGLAGNVMFTSRFVVQWYVSERQKKSVIPESFWRLSFAGGIIQLIYGIHLGAVPVILGYLLPPVIAARNMMIIANAKKAGFLANSSASGTDGAPVAVRASEPLPLTGAPSTCNCGAAHRIA